MDTRYRLVLRKPGCVTQKFYGKTLASAVKAIGPWLWFGMHTLGHHAVAYVDVQTTISTPRRGHYATWTTVETVEYRR